MDRIKSFTIDHDVLVPGFYISREDGNIITYDLRTRKPNAGSYMSNANMHSVEHMFATYVRNSSIGDNVIYFGPMGCQTGFYLVVKNETPQKAFEVTKDVLQKIIDHKGEVFGASAIECGHYENLDLAIVQEECKSYLEVLKNQKDMEFKYPTK
ncbi:S-ribosylhomocysteine lyase [Lachnobacterium bovis]|uniref:S-ribosylhomocysteine lyase n=1 Tax=Lachnobacterium bovis TaxID=140626 RepID=UPI0003B3D0E1|nr:S-ribosylhomocysteine lyase [Lachnobacterium bovis]